MSIRKRIGMRRWTASFTRHDGSIDSYGQPTYKNDSDWDVVTQAWPCELITTVGGEIVRGRMTHEKTTHVAYGEFFGTGSLTTKDRCVIDGKNYGISAIIDSDGLQMERRIELRGEF